MKFNQMLYHDDLSGIEKILRDSLSPVRPRAEFVAGLREKLSLIKPEPPVLPRPLMTVLFSTAGLLSGLLIVGAAARTIAGLIGMINLIRQVKAPKAQKATSPSPA